jgi:hypothetical protein
MIVREKLARKQELDRIKAAQTKDDAKLTKKTNGGAGNKKSDETTTIIE